MLAAASIAEHGGRYLVGGADPDLVEHDILPERRIVVVEFPDMATARRWYASSAYAEALAVRDLASKRRPLFVEGV